MPFSCLRFTVAPSPSSTRRELSYHSEVYKHVAQGDRRADPANRPLPHTVPYAQPIRKAGTNGLSYLRGEETRVDVEAQQLKGELTEILGIKGIEALRIINRYDVEGIDKELFRSCVPTVLASPRSM